MRLQRFPTSRRADVANAGIIGLGSLLAFLHRKGELPWYGSGMYAKRQLEIAGGRVRGPAEPSVSDGLHRYVPVPPVYVDADGYVVEDGMSQNDDHLDQTTDWYKALKRRHPDRGMVGSDLPMPYERGDRSKVLVPDLFVALRAERRPGASSYKLWENPVPEFVVEMLSPDTWRADVGAKRRTYQMLGVQECWLFDPSVKYLEAPLIGYRLHDGRYRRVEADASGRFPSKALGLELHVRAGRLRFRDPEIGRDLTTYAEAEERAETAEERAETAEERAETAEERAETAEERAETAEERAETAEERAETAEERAETAEERAETAEERAETAKKRTEATERELAELRAQLAALDTPGKPSGS